MAADQDLTAGDWLSRAQLSSRPGELLEARRWTRADETTILTRELKGVVGGMIGRVLLGFGVAVAFSAPALAELAMTGAPAAMRAAPSGKAQIVQRIPASAEIELAKCARGWCRAVWRKIPGYIPADAVVLGPPPATLLGNEMPPPFVYVQPTWATPPVWRWTGAYVGANFGFGNGGW